MGQGSEPATAPAKQNHKTPSAKASKKAKPSGAKEPKGYRRCSECDKEFGYYRSDAMTCGDRCRTERKRRLDKEKVGA